MGELKVEQMFATYRDVETLKKVLDKFKIEGLDDSVITDALIAVALISDANAIYDNKIKAINEKLPEKIKDYNKEPEKEYSEKEMNVINRYYVNWQESFGKAKDILLDENSQVELKDIRILTKEQIVSWAKSNKAESKITDAAILYKLMLKKS